jgi:hypothetical protein
VVVGIYYLEKAEEEGLQAVERLSTGLPATVHDVGVSPQACTVKLTGKGVSLALDWKTRNGAFSLPLNDITGQEMGKIDDGGVELPDSLSR